MTTSTGQATVEMWGSGLHSKLQQGVYSRTTSRHFALRPKQHTQADTLLVVMPPPFPLLAGAPQSGLSPGRMWPPYSSLISSAKAVYLQAGAAGCKSGGRMSTRPTRRAPSRESRDEAKHAGSGRGDNTRRGEGQQVEGDGEQTFRHTARRVRVQGNLGPGGPRDQRR